MASIIQTKLYKPVLNNELLVREDLQAAFCEKLKRKVPLTLLCAPAGYGKTCTAVQLTSYCNCKTVWISIDEADNKAADFFALIAAALRNSGIDTCEIDNHILSDIINTRQLAKILIQILSFINNDFILVLDDYHHIKSAEINESLRYVIKNLPNNVHIMISTREDPSIGIPRLRAEDRVFEIRSADLKLTDRECMSYCRLLVSKELPSNVLKILNEKTEGWISGVKLAALKIKNLSPSGIDAFIETFNGTNEYIIDYLVEEILNELDPELKLFLIKTSVLERMNWELCDYVTGQETGLYSLSLLHKNNMFLIPLDDAKYWWRYHHLFGSSLRALINPKEAKELYRKAGRWCYTNQFQKEALSYSIRAKDYDLSINIIENNIEEYFKSASLTSMLEALDQIPIEHIISSEELVLRYPWAMFITGRISSSMDYINRMKDDFIETLSPHNRGLLLSLKASFSQNFGSKDTEKLAAEALMLIEEYDNIARAATLHTLGQALQQRLPVQEVIETFEKAYEEGKKSGYSFITTLSVLYICNLIAISGRESIALQRLNNYLELLNADIGEALPISGIILSMLARIHMDMEQYSLAEEFLAKSLELCSQLSLEWILGNDLLKFRLKFETGDENTALSLISKYNNKAEMLPPHIKIRNMNLEAEFALLTKNFKQAETLISACEKLYPMCVLSQIDYSIITRCRLMLMTGKEASAIKKLIELINYEKPAGRQRPLANVFLLLGLGMLITGNIREAEYYIKEFRSCANSNTIQLTNYDRKYILLLIEEDKLSQVDISKINSELYRLIYPSKDKKCETNNVLSSRELELVALIKAGFSNRDISEKLFISMNTTQWHLGNIYSKLGVKNRTSALLKCTELGLLKTVK